MKLGWPGCDATIFFSLTAAVDITVVLMFLALSHHEMSYSMTCILSSGNTGHRKRISSCILLQLLFLTIPLMFSCIMQLCIYTEQR